MTFNSPLFGFRRFIYDTLGQVSQQRVNQIIQEGVKFQKNQPYNGDILTEEFQKFLNRLPKPISEQTVDQLVDKLLPYFSSPRKIRQSYVYTVTDEETGEKMPKSGETVRLVVNLGTPKKRVSFIPSFAEERENMDKPEPHSDMSLFRNSFYNVKNNLVRVSIDKLREEISGGVFKKSLQEFYKAFVEVLPIDIRLTTPSQKLSFLRKLNLVASDDIYDMRNNEEEMKRNLTPLTSEGQIEKFTKEIATVKKNIRNLVPIGRVPLRETTKAIVEALEKDYDLSKLGRMFVKGHALEDDLDEKVSQREDSKTFGEWIYRAIFSTAGSRPFQNIQVDEDYVPLEEEDDSFFDKKPTDTVDRSPQKPKIDYYILYIFKNTKGERVRIVTRDYGDGTLKPNKVQRILENNYQGDSPYSLEKTHKLSEEAYKKLGEQVINESKKFKEIATKLLDRYVRRTHDNEVYFDAEMFGEQLDRPVSYYFDATMFDDTTEAEERLRRYVREDVIEWTSKPIIANIRQIGSPPETRGSRIKPFSPLIGGVVVGSKEEIVGWIREKRLVHGGQFDTDVSLDPELFKMDLNELNSKERRRLKTFLQDADPTEFFGEEYLKLSKVINTLENIVGSSEEEELEGMDEENLKLIKKLAHLRKRYENLYQDIYEMVYGEEE